MNFNKPTKIYETQGELIQAWEKEVDKELSEYPSTLSWELEVTDIKCPDCDNYLYRCYTTAANGERIYAEVNLLYCKEDKAFYNQGNITWTKINGSGGGSGGSGSIVRVIDNVLTIQDS
jgi:hypothetical protein